MANWTREQYIDLIMDYRPVGDMKSLDMLVREAINRPDWTIEIIRRDLPDRIIEKLAELCIRESNEFDKKHA